MAGFIISVSSNNRIWYLLGTILITLACAIVSVVFFVEGNTAAAVSFLVGVAVGAVFIIDAIANMRS